MCKIDLNTIVSAIVQRKTIPAEQIKLLLPKYIESSTKNTKAKTNTSTNFHKPQKKFQIVSMKCPLSRQPIKVPARSKKCSHLQCFDLGNFLLHSENTQTWRCPICRQQAKLEDLLIDGYLKNAFEKNRLYGEGKIQIFSDGKYNVINTNPEKIQFSLQQNSIFRIQSNSMHRNVPQSKNVGLNMNMNMSMSMKTNMKMKMNTNTNISNNDTGNGRKRDLLKILPAQKDLTTSSFNAIQQQQKKKNQKFGIRPNQQNQIESTIFALRKLSNCKSFQSSVLTIKK
ncbi:zinc finger miz domain-containing protein [Anaeramoeba flamelloides]|uniref:Zinc finger miz domain-containing protein n=1 Tax=Anaeramoeba flamelloides TaxID=1746091 RepID=A0AAV7ZVJ7_9EUKA|nr:zinc finger miz domain-containing protein [Anaeramoeba flamelloides]